MSPRNGSDAPTVFVIRMWLERSAGGDAQRGYVEHVATRSRRYFCEIGEALDFIRVLGARSRDERR